MSAPSPAPEDEQLRPGRLHPICCTVDVTAEFKDHLLDVNDPEGRGTFFVFVDDLNTQYTEEAEQGENNDVVNGPFKDKTPQECHTILRHLQRDNGSELDWSSFVIIDSRSLQDDTVLIVCDGEENGVLETVRSSLDVVDKTLALLLIGDISFDECVREAQVAKDGLWRFRHTDTFPGEGPKDWVKDGFGWDYDEGRWAEVGRAREVEGAAEEVKGPEAEEEEGRNAR